MAAAGVSHCDAVSPAACAEPGRKQIHRVAWRGHHAVRSCASGRQQGDGQLADRCCARLRNRSGAFRSLETLVLNGCDLSLDLLTAALCCTPALRQLHVANVGLRALPLLDPSLLPHLELVDLSGNQLADWRDMCRSLAPLTSLVRLHLNGTPLAEIPRVCTPPAPAPVPTHAPARPPRAPCCSVVLRVHTACHCANVHAARRTACWSSWRHWR